MPKRETKSKTEVLHRVEIVQKLILQGFSVDETIAYCQEKLGWRAGRRSILTYRTKAHKQLAADAKPRRLVEIGKASRRLETLYRLALQREDHANALGVVKERIRLFGLAEPERQAVDHTTAGEPIRLMIVEELVSADKPPPAGGLPQSQS